MFGGGRYGIATICCGSPTVLARQSDLLDLWLGTRQPWVMKMARVMVLYTLLAACAGVAEEPPGRRTPAVEPIAAFSPGARILFQGDSSTDGNRGRSADPNHILGHGYVFLIAARHGAAFPGARLRVHQPRHQRQHRPRFGTSLASGHTGSGMKCIPPTAVINSWPTNGSESCGIFGNTEMATKERKDRKKRADSFGFFAFSCGYFGFGKCSANRGLGSKRLINWGLSQPADHAARVGPE